MEFPHGRSIQEIEEYLQIDEEILEAEEKEKSELEEEISELKSVILQIEWNLDLLTFGKMKHDTQSDRFKDAAVEKVPHADIELQSHLYRYSGLYCTKNSNEECVLNFSSSYKFNRKDTYAVQIFTKGNNVGTLGKWVMPMSIDLTDLISDDAVDNVNDIPSFCTTCKHLVNCYFLRREQYNELEETVSKTKNCSVQSNEGYTQINLEVTGIYNEKDNLSINVAIYLLYDCAAIKPYEIKVDSKTETKLTSDIEEHLKASLQCFMVFNLQIAFEKMLSEEPFVWSKEDDEDSPLQIISMSSSDEEGYLKEISIDGKKSLTFKKKKRKKKKTQLKETSKNNISNLSRVSKHNEESTSSEDEKQISKSINKHLGNLKENNVIESISNINISKQETSKNNISNLSRVSKHNEESTSSEDEKRISKSINKHLGNLKDNNVIESTSNMNISKQKTLKQTKLKFLPDKNLELHTNNYITPHKIIISKKKIVNKNVTEPFTSTPMQRHIQNSKLSAPTRIDISDITVNGNTSNN